MELEASAYKVAGVVVLYNSPNEAYKQILTYIDQLEKLYVIDNSSNINQWLWSNLATHRQVQFDFIGQNLGIATALNRAAQKAMKEGFLYLLTMDDDSAAPADMVERLRSFYEQHADWRIGIVSPKHILSLNDHRTSFNTLPYREVSTIMTSGNLINLSAFYEVGAFRDDLFIDVVDHEFNLRLRKAGYKIIELQEVLLKHDLGFPKKVLSGLVSYVSHSPIRNYYLIRNSLLVAKANSRDFPGYWLTALLTIFIEIVKIALFEGQKLLRLKMILQSLWHGFLGRGGEYRSLL